MWATCTEPCRVAHFSGVFFKDVLAELQRGNLTRGRCVRTIGAALQQPKNRQPSRRRMLTYVKQGCCSRLVGG